MGTENNNLPSYLRIAQKIERHILLGKIAKGHKLGSIRQLAKRESVSINTIRSALETLTQSGIINSVPRIGFVVSYQRADADNSPFENFIPDSRLAEPSKRWLTTMVMGNRGSNAYEC